MKNEELRDLIAESIMDSLEPDWNPQSCADHILLWLDEAGMCILPNPIKITGHEVGTNEWLSQSPQFHPGDIA
jgi:hypothetical protein